MSRSALNAVFDDAAVIGTAAGPHATPRAAQVLPRSLSGPGWYESSDDLRRGLEVMEGLPSDTPLADWLALWLGSAPTALTQRPGVPTYRS